MGLQRFSPLRPETVGENNVGETMKRKISTEFKKARREMIERKTKCHECEDYATELHHIIAVEDGGQTT